ncbi:hypothetical protein CL628_01695 [bacterium]|nr:hypothetical protein [bacterium]
MNKLIILLVVTALLVPSITLAVRQPRVVDGEVVTEVNNPDIAQDFFGFLSGEPEFFLFSLQREQELYISLRVMDIADAVTDVSGSLVKSDGEILVELDGTTADWIPTTDPTAGVTYLHGPETRVTVSPGDYLFGVSSLGSDVPYILAVGETEEELGGDVVSAIGTLGAVREDILNREAWEAYIQQAGAPIVIGTVIAVIFGIIGLIFLLRFFR